MQRVIMNAVAFALVGGGAATHGAVGYTSQTRLIQTYGGVGVPQMFDVTSPDFGPFVASRTDYFANPDDALPSLGQAAQNSTLGADFIRVTGSVSGTDNYGSGGAGSGFGFSFLDVTFTLSQDVPFSFFGTHTSSFNLGSSGISAWEIRLARVGGPVLFERTVALLFQGAPDQFPGPFTRSGVLTAGQYRLEAQFAEGWTGFSTGSGSGSFDLTLQVPGPGTAVGGLVFGVAGLRRRRRTIAAV